MIKKTYLISRKEIARLCTIQTYTVSNGALHFIGHLVKSLYPKHLVYYATF